jgi:hypothetical protein
MIISIGPPHQVDRLAPFRFESSNGLHSDRGDVSHCSGRTGHGSSNGRTGHGGGTNCGTKGGTNCGTNGISNGRTLTTRTVATLLLQRIGIQVRISASGGDANDRSNQGREQLSAVAEPRASLVSTERVRHFVNCLLNRVARADKTVSK